MHTPDDLLYSRDHAWIRSEGDEAVIGVTRFAVEQLGDVAFVELPDPKAIFSAGDVYGVIESAKAASDLFLPVSGEITASNPALNDSPELVNDDPYGEGWLARIKITDPSDLDGLIDAVAYTKLTED